MYHSGTGRTYRLQQRAHVATGFVTAAVSDYRATIVAADLIADIDPNGDQGDCDNDHYKFLGHVFPLP
jgi:hypothetical protein